MSLNHRLHQRSQPFRVGAEHRKQYGDGCKVLEVKTDHVLSLMVRHRNLPLGMPVTLETRSRFGIETLISPRSQRRYVEA